MTLGLTAYLLSKNYGYYVVNTWLILVILCSLEVLGMIYLPVSYGVMGITYIYMACVVFDLNMSRLYLLPVLVLLNGFYIPYSLVACSALVIVWLYDKCPVDFNFMKSKAWYWFYPVHLFGYALVKMI
jgi:hypothetical protein